MAVSVENAPPLYVSESGSDETGKGTEQEPVKTILKAMHLVGKEPFPTIYVDSKTDGEEVEIKPLPWRKMAEQNTDVVTCTVCLEVFIEPKVLPCCHTFCKKCLESILDQSESKEKLACPQCREEHQVPSSGLGGFVSDFTLPVNEINQKQHPEVDKCEQCDDRGTAVCFCTECSAHLCDSCTNAHKKMKLLKSHKMVSLDSDGVQFGTAKPKVLYCSQHPDKALDAYCQSCQCVVCISCVISSHNGHHFVEIDKILRKDVEKQIEDLVGKVQTKLTDFEASHKYISDVEKETVDDPIPMRAEINRVFDSLVTELEAQRSALLEKVDASFNGDLKELWAQKEHVEKTIASLRGTLSFTERSLQCSHDLEFHLLGSQVMASLKKLKEVNWDSSSTDLINRTLRKVEFREISDIDLAMGELETMTMKDDMEVVFEMPLSAKLGQQFKFKVDCRMSKSKRREEFQSILNIFHGQKCIDIPHPPEVLADPVGKFLSVAFVPVVSGNHVVKVKLRTCSGEDVTKEAVVSVTGEPAVDQIVQRGPDWIYGNIDGGRGCQGHVSSTIKDDHTITVNWIKTDNRYRFKWGTDGGCYDIQLVV